MHHSQLVKKPARVTARHTTKGDLLNRMDDAVQDLRAVLASLKPGDPGRQEIERIMRMLATTHHQATVNE